MLLVPVLIVVVVVLVGAALFAGVATLRGSERRRGELHEAADSDTPVLRYHVPVRQDPAAVIASLQQHGYEAVEVEPQGSTHAVHDVLVLCPGGVEREREPVRAALLEADANLDCDPTPPHHVRFADE